MVSGAWRWIVERVGTVRLAALGWAAPYLIFVLFPIIALVRGWDGSWRSYAVAALLAGFVLTYCVVWLLADQVPISPKVPVVVLVVAGVLALIQVGLWALTDSTMIFMLAYLIPFILLLPGWLIVPFIGAVGLIAVAESITAPIPIVWNGYAIIAVNVFVMLFVRISIVRDREGWVSRERSHALARERQRLQLASDLHDVLGQQLTAISVKAELMTRLLGSGQVGDERVAAARSEAADVAGLARQALTDVRAVVATTRQARLDEELDQARALLTAAGITLDVTSNVELDDIDPASVVGRFAPYVIREGCANVVHHARGARTVWVHISESGVTVSDDGLGAGAGAGGAGSGLTGLAERVGEFGRVTYGPRDDGCGWRVELRGAAAGQEHAEQAEHAEREVDA